MKMLARKTSVYYFTNLFSWEVILGVCGAHRLCSPG